MSHDVVLKTRLRLLDEEALREAATERGCTARAIEAVIVEMLLNPSTSTCQIPADLEVLSADATKLEGAENVYELTTRVRITNEQALREGAQECYESNWSDSSWEPETLGEAAHELLLASNANQSPSDMGFEFLAWNYVNNKSFQ